MAYENIQFLRYNMAAVNNNFFMFDHVYNKVVQKTDGGDTAFEYPLDVDLTSIEIGSDIVDLDPVTSTQYDGTYFWTLQMIDTPPPVNVALYKTCSQSNTWWPYVAAYAVDNNTSTFQHTTNAAGEWWKVDLADTYVISTLQMVKRSGYGTRPSYYYIQTADDYAFTINVVNIITEINNTNLTTTWTKVDFGVVSTRYLRILCHTNNQYMNIAEFRVYGSSVSGLIIRKWLIDNYVCKLKETFEYTDTGTNTYQARTFGIEHYLTEFSNNALAGNNTINIDAYYDTVLGSGTVLNLGPNTSSQIEDVTVSGVIGSDVILYDNLQYSYSTDDQVGINRSFFLFNDYNGIDSSEGSLMRFSSLDGSYMSKDVDVDYKSVYASTFSRFQNVLFDYPDAYALVYVKGTNAKLRNMSDLISVTNASSVDDDFTGSNWSLPNSTRWSITNGNPRIYNNALFCATVINGTDEIESNYVIIGDFDVQVSGTVSGFSLYPGDSDFNHYMYIEFPYDSNENCEIGASYYSSDEVVLYTAKNDVVESVVSGTSSNYLFRLTRVDTTVNFYYKTVVSGVPAPSWTSFGSSTMYDSGCSLSLGLYSKNVTVSGSYFDDLIYNSGSIMYPAAGGEYYGTMNMDNVRANGSTVITIYDISILGSSMYRLQDEATYYGVDNDWGTQYNYQVSTIRPFIDFITVGAYPEILPATGRNVSQITAVVLDQYGEGAVNKPVDFTDDDTVGYITTPQVYTDYFHGTGEAKTGYMSGVDIRLVTVQGTATQYD